MHCRFWNVFWVHAIPMLCLLPQIPWGFLLGDDEDIHRPFPDHLGNAQGCCDYNAGVYHGCRPMMNFHIL